MPGIAGTIGHRAHGQGERLMRQMIASMSHEASYHVGAIAMPEIGLNAGWVAHPDSFASRVSGIHENGELGIAFSGECLGPPAASLRGFIAGEYREHGEVFIASLNGLFSGLIADRKRGRAIIFNDRYSSERIYYHQTKECLYFASEIKALLQVLPELREFDYDGVAQHFAYGCALGQRTLFRGISQLPGATCWLLDGDNRERRATYFQPTELEGRGPISPQQFTEQFTDTFDRVLPKYCKASEVLGISLTGGLDTRMIMASLEPDPSRQVCYTFAGSSDNLLDSKIAAKVARCLGLEHHVIRIGEQFLKQYSTELDKTITITGGTAGALCAHEVYLNRNAHDLARIRLTGNFGSEVLRGASTFKPLGLERNLFDGEWRTRITAQEANDPRRDVHPTTFAAFREVPWSLFGSMAAGRSQVTFRTPYLDNELVALAYRTPEALRGSASPALELIRSRSPSIGAIPTDRGRTLDESGVRHVLRRAASELSFKLDYMHKEGLPSSLAPLSTALGALDRAGFLGQHKFLAYRLWYQNELRAQIRAVLSDDATLGMPFWNRAFLEQMLDAHVRGARNYVREIGAVLTLESIQRNLLGFSDICEARDDFVSQKLTGIKGPAYV